MYAAWITPSASNAIVTSACSWRDLPGREQVLAAVLDPLHRRADLRRREHQAHLVALHQDLLAEAAAGVAHDDADAVLGHAEQAGAEEAHLVRRLRRRVDRELAGRRATSRRRGRGLPSAPARTPAGRSSRVTTCAPAANASSSADAGRPLSRRSTFEPCCSCTSASACSAVV